MLRRLLRGIRIGGSARQRQLCLTATVFSAVAVLMAPQAAFAATLTDGVSVAYTWLAHGEAFWVNSLPNERFFFLETDPDNPGTAILTRGEAVRVPGMYVAGNCTLYRANHSGWHGLLLVSDRAPVTTVPASGIAVALHRFDPARPHTCPQRNFPDYPAERLNTRPHP